MLKSIVRPEECSYSWYLYVLVRRVFILHTQEKEETDDDNSLSSDSFQIEDEDIKMESASHSIESTNERKLPNLSSELTVD